VRALLLPVVLALAVCLLAGPTQAAGPLASLPPGWSHASINVVIRHVPHTLTYDRGRVVAVSASSLTLRERDGSLVTVAVDPASKVVIAGQPGSLSSVRRLEIATTMSIDGAPATTVRVQIPPGLRAAIAAVALKRGSAGR
jgi:hypothetical protein